MTKPLTKTKLKTVLHAHGAKHLMLAILTHVLFFFFFFTPLNENYSGNMTLLFSVLVPSLIKKKFLKCITECRKP